MLPKEIKTDHDVSRMCDYLVRGVTMAASQKLKQIMEFIATTMIEQEREAVSAAYERAAKVAESFDGLVEPDCKEIAAEIRALDEKEKG